MHTAMPLKSQKQSSHPVRSNLGLFIVFFYPLHIVHCGSFNASVVNIMTKEWRRGEHYGNLNKR